MIIYYNEDTKRIISAIAADSPDTEPPRNEGVPLYLDDTEYANVRSDLANYVIENGVPVYSAVPPSAPQPPTLSQQEQIDNLNKQLATLSDTTDFLLGM